ncbi:MULTISPECIES: flavodoxin family protein [Parageobacillus]|uniref:NAD(P)H dehydrogenase n=1 Tax=Parageobacillus galactosidasius TaxID=883812 RepID=A0A226QPC6_9BACL|nr:MULTISPECIES: flavodoxin family protein [Parageobacillus]MED4989299.1 flavodoxin family protein [Parageobacillus toebii]OXB93332.1 NAD(P)H dehydrogenase [Parageobacillus galactosidasius]
MAKILVLNGSSRENGNTEQLTDVILEGVSSTRINIRDFLIQPIVDKRHDPAGFTKVSDDYDQIIELVLQHDVLIFATPIYWYGMSGHMKQFIDRWSQSLRDTRFSFKEEMKKKKAFVIICGGDNPYIKGLPLIQQFQYIFQFMGIEYIGYVIGEGNAPGDVLRDERAIGQAKYWNTFFVRYKILQL